MAMDAFFCSLLDAAGLQDRGQDPVPVTFMGQDTDGTMDTSML